MRDSDIRVLDAAIDFRDVRLAQPFEISGRPITFFTIAEVSLEVETRTGRRARGHGQSVLSVPWAWPHSELTVPERDEVLRALVRRFTEAALAAPAADPIHTWRRLTEDLDEVCATAAGEHQETVPRLAGLLTVGAIDNALHDGWGKAAGRSSLAMCTADYLSHDLSWLDPDLRGRYPAEALREPDPALAIQHVVSINDELTSAGADGERALADWLDQDQSRYLKVKVTGADPAADAQRVIDIHDVAARLHGRISIAVDPNEGYPDPQTALLLIEEISRRSPATAAAIDYLEQPVPRTAAPDPAAMTALSARVPTLLDEGFDRLSSLLDLTERGWSGVVIKASKGQTSAIVTAAVARARGLWCVVQDLTASSFAMAHSARLVSEFALTRHHLEFNSRQFAPASNDGFAQRHPGLVTVRDGMVHYPDGDGAGLYGFAG